MMIECKYCGGSGKLHDDADAYDEVGEWQARAQQAEAAHVRLVEVIKGVQAERDIFIARIKRLEETLAMAADAFERLGFLLVAKQCRMALEEGGG